MLNNVVLDVFIGIVLVYLLYSLFVTIVGEMLATWMALRSRILRVAIEKMLTDCLHDKNNPAKTFRQRAWNVVQRYFLKEFEDFKHGFAGKFYENPAIKYLSDNGGEKNTPFSQTKPSYISAEMFAETLIRLLINKGAGRTDMEKINFCLDFNTYHIDPATLKNLLAHAGNSGNDISILKERFKGWYNETMDRATGWYKRKLQLILFWLGFIVAVIFNVDSIKIIKILAKDKEARNQLADMAVAMSKDTARFHDFVSAGGDTLHTKAILDSGLAHVIKDVSDANLVLGLGWPPDNLNTCETKSYDQASNSYAFGILKLYQDSLNHFGKSSSSLQSKIREEQLEINILKQKVIISRSGSDVNTISYEQLLKLDSMTGTDTARLKQQLKSNMQLMKDSLQAVWVQLRIAESTYQTDSTLLAMLIQSRNEAVRQINQATSFHFGSIDSVISKGINSETLIVYTKTPYSTFRKISHLLYHYCNPFHSDFWRFLFSLRFLGFLITALMISLGAPFWFGMLKKIASIRGAGVKPEEKEQEKGNQRNTDDQPVSSHAVNFSPLEANAPVEDIYEEALKKYADAIQQIPGVKSVFTVTKNKIKQVQANVDTAATKEAVIKQFPELTVGSVSIPLQVTVSGTPSSHGSLYGIIANKSGKNGFGSLGCILNRPETGVHYLLSCWHVLKGDLNYSGTDDQRVIIDRESSREIGDRLAGGIRDHFDYGLARCRPNMPYKDNSFLKEKFGLSSDIRLDFRHVSKVDVDDQISVKYFDGLNDTVVRGLIYTTNPAVTINYIDRSRIIRDVLMLTNENEKTISQEGNSGSLVFDANNKAIAMIIAGDLNYTYAVKLSAIFAIHNEMIIA